MSHLRSATKPRLSFPHRTTRQPTTVLRATTSVLSVRVIRRLILIYVDGRIRVHCMYVMVMVIRRRGRGAGRKG